MRTATGLAPPGEIWIGDDAAVVAAPPGSLVLATDAVVEGVHADLRLGALDDFGWKALVAALSDVGAMGAAPLHALVSIGAPAGTDLDRLVSGIAAASAAWQCPVVGGDLTSAPAVVVSVAVTGTLVGEEPPVTRGGAAPGDLLFVTGPLGASAAGLRLLRQSESGRSSDPPAAAMVATGSADAGAGLVRRHLRPVPRLAEGQAARSGAASAMMDVSDGLAIDLHRLADASGVGFAVGPVPVADGATVEEALGGGEDYELVIATADPQRLLERFADAGLDRPIRLGQCTAEPRERLCDGRPLPRLGWEHEFG